jgi:hypothetical protein
MNRSEGFRLVTVSFLISFVKERSHTTFIISTHSGINTHMQNVYAAISCILPKKSDKRFNSPLI